MLLFELWNDFFSARDKLLALMNLMFFGGVFLASFGIGFVFGPVLSPPWSLPSAQSLFGNNFYVMMMGIFLLNLVISAFVLVTLSGLVFFPLSAAMLGIRAFLWGLVIYASPADSLLWALPTLVIEGEAYVLAGAAGTIAGVSWLIPKWLHRKENVTREESFSAAVEEIVPMYVLVTLLLFVGAILETATILGRS